MSKPKRIRLIALNIDGVVLPDTFSPVIHSLVKRFDGEYTREIERNVFSQQQEIAAAFLIDKLRLTLSIPDLIKLYFEERDIYLRENPIRPAAGLKAFLEDLKELGVRIICYGGLDISHFHKEMGAFIDYFDGERYICTNDFRPGMREIVRDYHSLDYENVLFIDDVNRVAEEAKSLNIPFIGIPSSFAYGYQKADMKATGVKYIVSSIRDVDKQLILNIDKEIAENTLWTTQ